MFIKNGIKMGIVSLVMLFSIMMSCVISNAAYSDLTPTMKYYSEATRISALNIIKGDDKGLFRPTAKITREQFISTIFKALGQSNVELDEKLKTTPFVDVDGDRWSYKFIATALNNGWIGLNAQKSFYPEDEIKFGEACTIAVKALTSDKVEGQWPGSYINKAYEMTILKELKMNPLDKITRLDAAVILDRIWYLNTIKTKNFDYSELDATESGTEIIVTADSKTNKKLKDNQVQTNLGVFKKIDSGLKLVSGGKYKVFLYEDTIMCILEQTVENVYASLKSAVGSDIRINDFEGNFIDYVLPEKLEYYYNGAKIAYSVVKTKLDICSSIVFGYNKTKTDYDYAVIIDPIYSDPHIVTQSDIERGTAGLLAETDKSAIIIRDGKLVVFKDIEQRDVVYKVTDVKGKNPYYPVFINRVEGKITDIMPNVLAPSTIVINGRNYDLSDKFSLKKLGTGVGSFSKDSYAQALIGYDGRVVDLYDDASDIAMVINTSTRLSETKAGNVKTTENYVLLMSTDGRTTEYKSVADYKELKGVLVRFKLAQTDMVDLERVAYSGSLDLNVKKDDKMINDMYVADNVKIFNRISNATNVDVSAQTLSWRDLPNGKIPWEKVYHVGTGGDFGDINVLVLNDLFDDSYKFGYAKDNPTFYYVSTVNSSQLATFNVNGTAYTFSVPDNKVRKGDLFKLVLGTTSVTWINNTPENKVEVAKIQAFDTRRIKADGKIYPLSNRVKIANIEKNNTLSIVTKENFNITKSYSSIALFVKNEFGTDKVVYVVTRE